MSVQISMRVSKEQKEKLVELAKKQNKSLTQYVLDACLVEDVDTVVESVAHSNERVEKMLQSQCARISNVSALNLWIKSSKKTSRLLT